MEYSQKKATGKNRIYVFAFSCSVVSCFILPLPPPLASAAIKVSASASAQIQHMQQLQLKSSSNPTYAAVAAQIQLKSNICSSCNSNRTAPVLISRKCNICLRHIFREPFSVFVFVFVCRHESSNTTSPLAATSPPTHNERVMLFCFLCCFLYLCLSLLLPMHAHK